MRLIGTALWLLAVLWAIAQGLNIRGKARSEQATEHTFEVHALLLAVSVVVVPALSLSPLHLLWMVPASFVLGLGSVIFPLNLLWLPASLYATLWYVGIRNPALALYRAGEYTRAIDAFKEAIQRRPSSVENHFYLALAYDKVGEHGRAIGSLQECIRLKPDFAEAHCNLGFTFRDMGEMENAVKAFSEAIRVRPDYAKAIANLGMLYVHLGDLDNAREQCAKLETVDMAQARELRAAITAAE
jgi:tetratricopeptide (TPR) repeat protein